MESYAALGLLAGIPLPPKQSSSRSHKASLPFLPPHLRPALTEEEEEAAKPRVGFGRIIRDEEGNVVDIIIDEEPQAAEGAVGEDGEGWGEGEGMGVEGEEEEEEGQGRRVEAKTDVVRCEYSLYATRDLLGAIGTILPLCGRGAEWTGMK